MLLPIGLYSEDKKLSMIVDGWKECMRKGDIDKVITLMYSGNGPIKENSAFPMVKNLMNELKTGVDFYGAGESIKGDIGVVIINKTKKGKANAGPNFSPVYLCKIGNSWKVLMPWDSLICSPPASDDQVNKNEELLKWVDDVLAKSRK